MDRKCVQRLGISSKCSIFFKVMFFFPRSWSVCHFFSWHIWTTFFWPPNANSLMPYTTNEWWGLWFVQTDFLWQLRNVLHFQKSNNKTLGLMVTKCNKRGICILGWAGGRFSLCIMYSPLTCLKWALTILHKGEK